MKEHGAGPMAWGARWARALAVAVLAAAPAGAQYCTNCIFNQAAPQVAQLNITSGTVRGVLTVDTVNTVDLTVYGTLSAAAFAGDGAGLVNLSAAALASGTLPAARVVGAYPSLTGAGILTSGTWRGNKVLPAYGGTGADLSLALPGGVPYFVTGGTLASLSPPSGPRVLMAPGGAGAPVWTSSPSLTGQNFSAIPLTALAAGTLPHSIAVDTNSIANTNGAGVLGNIPGGAAFLTVPLPIGNLAAGTLPTTNAASSVTVTGVVPGTYGGPYIAAQLHVMADGRVDVANQYIITVGPGQIGTGALAGGTTVDPRQISTGTFPTTAVASSITATGVTAGTYGSPSASAQFQVGTDGRLRVAAQYPIFIGPSQLAPGALPGGVTVDPRQLSTGTFPTWAAASSITVTGVGPGTYGGPNSVVQVTVGADGRISAASAYNLPGVSSATAFIDRDNRWTHAQTSLSSWTILNNFAAQIGTFTFVYGNGGFLTSLTPSNVAAGTLPVTVIASSVAASGVVQGSYGSAVVVPRITIGPDGRVSAVSSFTITGVPASTVPASGVLDGQLNPGVLLYAGSLSNGPVASSILPSTVAYYNSTGTFSAPQAFPVGLTASSGTFTNSGANIFSMTTSSGANIGAGPLYLNTGGYIRYPDGSTQATAFPQGVFVLKTGDQMSGALFLNGSTLTVGGNAFSVGTSTFVITSGRVGVGTTSPATLLDVNGAATIRNSLDMSGTLVSNAANPLSAQDLATKIYVDSATSAVDVLGPARAATITALPANSYSNGSAGVGAMLTGLSIGGLNIDGVDMEVNYTVLVKNEASNSRNGYYRVSQVGSLVVYILTRMANHDQPSEMTAGATVIVTSGTVNTLGGTAISWWTQTSSVTTVGTDPVTFIQSNGLDDVVAGNGISITNTNGANTIAITSTMAVLGNAFSVGGSTLVVAGGSVGFGTSSPASAVLLDVNGGAAVRGQLTVAGSSVTAMILKASGDASGAGTGGYVDILNTTGGYYRIGEQTATLLSFQRQGGYTAPASFMDGYVTDALTTAAFGGCTQAVKQNGANVEICSAKSQDTLNLRNASSQVIFGFGQGGGFTASSATLTSTSAAGITTSSNIVVGANVVAVGAVFSGNVAAAKVALTSLISAPTAQFTNVGAEAFSIIASSGGWFGGRVQLGPGGYIQWADGTRSTTAASGSGGSAFTYCSFASTQSWDSTNRSDVNTTFGNIVVGSSIALTSQNEKLHFIFSGFLSNVNSGQFAGCTIVCDGQFLNSFTSAFADSMCKINDNNNGTKGDACDINYTSTESFSAGSHTCYISCATTGGGGWALNTSGDGSQKQRYFWRIEGTRCLPP